MYVRLAVQMLGKSFKTMSVTVWGKIVSGNRYGATDWLIVGALTGGVLDFLVTGPTSSNDDPFSLYGLMLPAGLVVMEGFTLTFQEDSFKRHVISKCNQMLYFNSWLLYNFFVQFDPPVQLIRPAPVPS